MNSRKSPSLEARGLKNDTFGCEALGQLAALAVALAPDAKQDDDIVEVNQAALV